MMGGRPARILDRLRIIAYIGVAPGAWIGLELLWEGLLIAKRHPGPPPAEAPRR